jgi:hypothetical protein
MTATKRGGPATNNGTATRTTATEVRGDGTTPDQILSRFLDIIEANPAPRWQRELARDGFTPWLIAQKDRPFQEGRSDWIRDLARDVAYDTAWPRGQVRLRELHDYLYDLHALDNSHVALDLAWAEWREATG